MVWSAVGDDIKGEKAAELKNAACSLCNAMRDGEGHYEDLVKELKRIEPSISKREIDRLYGYGMFVTR